MPGPRSRGLSSVLRLAGGARGHLRTTNSIESTFATVRARTDKTRGGLSRVTRLAMVFTLYQSAAKRWHRLRAAHYLPEVMNGIVFKDGIQVERDAA